MIISLDPVKKYLLRIQAVINKSQPELLNFQLHCSIGVLSQSSANAEQILGFCMHKIIKMQFTYL